jgi:hypothetical protein
MSTIDSGHCGARHGHAKGNQEAVLVGRGESVDLFADAGTEGVCQRRSKNRPKGGAKVDHFGGWA